MPGALILSHQLPNLTRLADQKVGGDFVIGATKPLQRGLGGTHRGVVQHDQAGAQPVPPGGEIRRRVVPDYQSAQFASA